MAVNLNRKKAGSYGKKMIAYLQSMLTKFKEMEVKNYECEGYYSDSEMIRVMDNMIGCKDMIEALIEKPVNLGIDGKVTIGR